ncbi:Glycosyl transferase family 2 [Caballeronia pedi]|uniref:Glycosyl transferase family 2 n=1 Tax=Caballeronia pedi TaxID=1777141 RepID=A0A158E4R9_9BURK|nr:Glycosyl transferase family 2 [Caballeronia pedi]
MLSVVIPAHNEAALIGPCLNSVRVAASHPGLGGERVLIVVVADGCSDLTEAIAVSCGALVLSTSKHNVGSARDLGARLAIAHETRWLAFTDADTTVHADWLVEQLECATDAVCGVITISDWTGHHAETRADFVTTYRDVEGHRHVHGANFGLSTLAYEATGGFQPLTFNEDVALVQALTESGFTIAWTNKVRVDTSARTEARTPWGFGATLRAVSEQIKAGSAGSLSAHPRYACSSDADAANEAQANEQMLGAPRGAASPVDGI